MFSRAVVSSLLLVGCGFSGNAAPASVDASVDAMVTPPIDAPLPPPPPRRLLLTIPAAQVTGPLDDFPVYVDINDATSRADLRMKVNAAGTNLSFRLRTGASTTTPLAYERVSWDSGTGRLIAWVKLPMIEATAGADTAFELHYGTADVAVAPNPPMVWTNGFLAVFHLDAINGTTFANSANAALNGTGVNVANRVDPGKLGNGVDFNNNNQVITFTNPITGAGPSTFSAWVSENNSNDNDSIFQVGNPATDQARFFYATYTGVNIGVGLYNNDRTSNTTIRGDGFRLLHWTYNNQQSRIYVSGAGINGNPYMHTSPAATAGTDGRIGNAKMSEFGNNMGLDGIIDEARIANVARSPEWIAAEYANQNSPATFVTVQPPDNVP